MKVLIVHAHHEPLSLNGALTHHAVEVLGNAGHDVVVSDLYAMQFDPVSDRRNFTTVANPARLRQQDEEQLASERAGFASELQQEMDRVGWCDLLVFQFPLWWLGPPAILKGWIDRVFAVGRAYGGGRYFDTGRFVGKRAMCSLTVGGPAEVYADGSAYAGIDEILFPIHRGVFAFTGFTVLEPFVVHGPNRMTESERTSHLWRYGDRLLHLDAARTIPAPTSAELRRFVTPRQRAEG